MDRSHLFEIVKMSREDMKVKKDRNADHIKGDDHLPTVKFKEQRDDRKLKLHKASMLRLPVLEPEKWYDQVPIAREEIFRSIPFSPTGSEHTISDVALERMHNRTSVIHLKYFMPENLSVSAKPMRETKRYEDDGLSTVVDLAWESASTVSQTTGAIISYGCALQQIWPMDTTGWAMMRLFNDFKWLVHVNQAKTRAQLIAATFNRITKTNGTRAANKECPLSFQEMEKILKSVLARNGQKTEAPVSGARPEIDHKQKSPWQGAAIQQERYKRYADGTSKRPGGQANQTARPPTVGNLQLCYGFNDKGKSCSYVLQPGGYSCLNPKGVSFAHACSNFIASKGQYCLARHPMKDCRNK